MYLVAKSLKKGLFFISLVTAFISPFSFWKDYSITSLLEHSNASLRSNLARASSNFSSGFFWFLLFEYNASIYSSIFCKNSLSSRTLSVSDSTSKFSSSSSSPLLLGIVRPSSMASFSSCSFYSWRLRCNMISSHFSPSSSFDLSVPNLSREFGI